MAKPQWKEWIITHPKKGKIPLGKLSHNELCRFCFNLILECSRLQHELKTQGEKDEPKV